MSRPLTCALALLLFVLLLGGTPREGQAREEPPPPPVAGQLVAGQSAFASDLYRALSSRQGNLLFSPYSVHTALAMTRMGARGKTAAEMDRVLHLPERDVARACQELIGKVTQAPLVDEHGEGGRQEVPAYAFSVANALWGQRGFPFVPAYRALLREAFAAELTDVDFARGAQVRKQINDWVLAKTKDKIKDLIPEGLPTADTRLALVNAVHFLAQWEEPFGERSTTDKPFTNEKGESVVVKMMRRIDRMRTFVDGDARVLALPYKGSATEMLVVLPRDPAGLAALEQGLTAERLERWGKNQQGTRVSLELPRMRFEASADLSDVLEGLGMGAAFSASQADFSGMATSPSEPLFIGVVLHKAFIAVDEKGTEAAAATALMMRAGSAPPMEEPLPFVCDRPFLFFLRHAATGAILFAGRYSLPDPAPR